MRMRIAQVLSAGLLGVAGPLLASCGSSGGGLIPTANAGPLQSDFEAVAQAAEHGNGNCAATDEAIQKTERDFAALPGSIDTGLRKRLHEGIGSLRADALEICKQPAPQATVTSTSPRTTPTTRTTPTATTPTQTTSTPTQSTPATTPTTTGTGGGTPAPGSSGGEGSSGAGSGGGSEQGGAGAGSGGAGGGSGGAGGAAPGAGGLEGGK